MNDIAIWLLWQQIWLYLQNPIKTSNGYSHQKVAVFDENRGYIPITKGQKRKNLARNRYSELA